MIRGAGGCSFDSEEKQAGIDAFGRTIQEKYAAGFADRMDAVVAAAKPYAEKNGLKVNWNVGASSAALLSGDDRSLAGPEDGRHSA